MLLWTQKACSCLISSYMLSFLPLLGIPSSHLSNPALSVPRVPRTMGGVYSHFCLTYVPSVLYLLGLISFLIFRSYQLLPEACLVLTLKVLLWKHPHMIYRIASFLRWDFSQGTKYIIFSYFWHHLEFPPIRNIILASMLEIMLCIYPMH